MPKQELIFDESAFNQEVVNSDRPVLIDFWAPWCRPCQMMMPILEQIAQEYGDKIKIIKVDISSNQEAAQRFNILSVPTLISFLNGQEHQRVVGLQNQVQLKKISEELLSLS